MPTLPPRIPPTTGELRAGRRNGARTQPFTAPAVRPRDDPALEEKRTRNFSFDGTEPANVVVPGEGATENAVNYSPAESACDLPTGAPLPTDQIAARGARYYQPRPSPAAKIVAPEELELMAPGGARC